MHSRSAAGFIEKLVVKIPWSQLKSEPIVIEIYDLLLLATPAPFPNFNAEGEAEKVHAPRKCIHFPCNE